jgi:hypothetical protein
MSSEPTIPPWPIDCQDTNTCYRTQHCMFSTCPRRGISSNDFDLMPEISAINTRRQIYHTTLWQEIQHIIQAYWVGQKSESAPAQAAKFNDPPWIPMSDPVDIKHVGKALEELGEAVAALARALIQGMDGQDPKTGKLNRDSVAEELAGVAVSHALIRERYKAWVAKTPRPV